ncbi:MAG: hypothetical protein ACOYN4_17820 [Bacteroidales bacterium]
MSSTLKEFHEISITNLDANSGFVINGNSYTSIFDLAPKKESVITQMENSDFDIYRDNHGKYILRFCQLFPCFDSSDRMYENRYYRRYMICRSMEEANEKYTFILSQNEHFNDINYNSAFLAPLIYADDESPIIRIMQ